MRGEFSQKENGVQKVIVIGCPGSGKSTFSKKLAKLTGLPLYHLDMLYWNEDKTVVPREVFTQRLCAVMKERRWIIDGNYASTMQMRMDACDTVFFLDYPTEVCLEGILQRRGKPRSDMPWTENESFDDEFVDFIKSYNSEQRPAVFALLGKYPSKDVHIFSSREQADGFLDEMI